MLFNVDIVNILLKNNGGETQSTSFYFRGLECVVVSMYVVAAWSRKSYLGPAEISSVAYLVKFKDRGRRVSCLYCFR